MREIVLIAHNLRSCHNVGSLLRTAEGLGVACVYLTGYSPYPIAQNDTRLPHMAAKIERQIDKTALGAQTMIDWRHTDNVFAIFEQLRSDGFTIVGLEQTPNSIALPDFAAPQKIALVVGREREGVEPEVLAAVNMCIEIPMAGRKESFNVVQAAAMTLYHCRFSSKIALAKPAK